MAQNETLAHSDALLLQISEAGIVLLDEQQSMIASLAWSAPAKTVSLFWEKQQIKKSQIKQIRVEIIHSLFLLLPADYDVFWKRLWVKMR
jgi:hypothetical protein